MLEIVAACLVITALLAWVNQRFIHLPPTIGVMVVALCLSLVIVGVDAAGWIHGMRASEEAFVASINFSDVVMQGMLSLLLFAGALHIDLTELRSHRFAILMLAVVGTILSTLIVGFAMWMALPFAGLELNLLYCLLFGALISPTDPIAVMGIMKSVGAPKDVELVIAGESLFNDGVGVVIFATILAAMNGGQAPTVGSTLLLLFREAGGGIVFGLALGYLTYRMLKSVDEYQVEVLCTLAAVMGGYAAASHLHVSGPLAMVVTGLFIGNQGRRLAMSDTTRRYVDMFWELVDGILNAVLFVLIGMQVLLVELSTSLFFGGVVAIFVTLAARTLSVGLPVYAVRALGLPKPAWRVLTWGALRGGISVALVLSLPPGPARDTVLALTYCVVIFSILAQGLTIGRVTRNAFKQAVA